MCGATSPPPFKTPPWQHGRLAGLYDQEMASASLSFSRWRGWFTHQKLGDFFGWSLHDSFGIFAPSTTFPSVTWIGPAAAG